MVEERFRSEYLSRIQNGQTAFGDIFEKTFKSDHVPLGIDGYSTPQEQMLLAALGVCVNPDILKESHCAHRAVAACIGLHFNKFPDYLVASVCQNMPTGFSMQKVGQGKDAARIFMAYGYNNWHGDGNDNLNCKIIPGAPNEVSTESLIHLEDRQMNGPQDFDNACPKRTKGLACHIEHAEASVIKTTLQTFQNLGVPPAEKTILACTWVPCPDCMEKIKTQKDVYGENIDVFSIYAAQGDEEDTRMAAEIRQILNPDGLDHLHGPYIKVPKDPGYGWYPAMKNTIETVKELVSKRSLVDRRINNVLYRAFDLAQV